MSAALSASVSQPSLQLALDRLLCRIIPWFLLIDCLNGALLQTLGNSYGLAAGYKLLLLSLMALSIALQQPRWLLALAVSWLALLVGPMLQWHTLSVRWALADVQLTLKLLSPLLALVYLWALTQRSSAQAAKLLKHSLLISRLCFQSLADWCCWLMHWPVSQVLVLLPLSRWTVWRNLFLALKAFFTPLMSYPPCCW